MLLNNLNHPTCHAACRANIKEAGRFGEQIQHSKEVAEANKVDREILRQGWKKPINTGNMWWSVGWWKEHREGPGSSGQSEFRKQEKTENNYYVKQNLKTKSKWHKNSFTHRYNWGIMDRWAIKGEKFQNINPSQNNRSYYLLCHDD